jgi:hypothetical protein
MDVDPGASWWQWAGGLAFAVLSGLFAFTHKRIGEVETELKDDHVQEITNLKNELTRMERMFNQRFEEGQRDRNEMWRTIRDNQTAQEAQHAQNLERLNKIPTREEMMQLLQQFMGRTSH